ncbi:MAG: GMC family oxidoreductase [Pseudolabrys sp.]|nr:GMC family oxidoreductase [Pseudolabrys sp.]
MLLDFLNGIPQGAEECEVCVIGTGAAGLTVAAELSKRNKRVIMVEGGGADIEKGSQNIYSAEVTGQPFLGATEGRIRVLGGTTTQWGGQIMEIDESVFAARDWIAGSGWPLEKKELAPYYLKAEKWEGIEYAETDVETVFKRIGLSEISFGDEIDLSFSRFCPVTNFIKIHADMIRKRKNVLVYLHANACAFILDDKNGTVKGVRCKALNGRSQIIYARTFVLCMGAIENSRLLLQPTENKDIPPWNRSGLVGRFFQDHISCFVASVSNFKSLLPERCFDYLSYDKHKYHLKLKSSPSFQESSEILNVCGTISRGGRDDLAIAYETVRLLRTRRFSDVTTKRFFHLVSNAPLLIWHKWPYGQRALKTYADDGELRLCVHCEQSPLSNGLIELSSERDVFGVLKAKVNWSISDLEVRSIRMFAECIKRNFESRDIADVSIYPEITEGGRAAAALFRESFHHIGGTRMAISDTQGVVDQNLRLFGTNNMYVCSSSVFPCAGFSNPTHTIIALSIRLAEYISGRSN